MRDVSSAFKSAVKKNSGAYLEKLEVTFLDSTELTLTEANIWQNGLRFEDSVSQDDIFQVGSAIINKATVVLNNIYNDFDNYDFVGATIVIYVGLMINGEPEYVKMGTYNVIDEPDYNGSFITIECLDNMCKFEEKFTYYQYHWVGSPVGIISYACQQCGVVFGEHDAIMRDPISQNYEVPKTVRTFREVISYLAQICGCYARCNSDGELEVKWYKTDRLYYDTLETFPPYPFEETTKTEYGVTFTDNGDGTITANGTNNTVAISDFYFFSGNVKLKPGQYYFNGCITRGSRTTFYIELTFGNEDGTSRENIIDYGDAYHSPRGMLFSVTSAKCFLKSIKIGVYPNATVNNVVFKAELTGYNTNDIFDDMYYLSSLYDYKFSKRSIEITGVRFFGKYQTSLGEEIEYDFVNGTDGYVLAFENNSLVNTNNGQMIADFVGGIMNGVKFMKGTVTHSSDPTIEAGDVAIVIDRNGNRCPIVVSSTFFAVGSVQKTTSAAGEASSVNSVRYSTNQRTYDTLTDYLALKVSKEGDTMTGDLVLDYDKPKFTQRGNTDMRMDASTLSANSRVGSIIFNDANERPAFYTETFRTTDNITYTSFVHRRYNSDASSYVNHGFYLDILNDGSPRVRFPTTASREAWISGLGVNNAVIVKTASNVSVASGTAWSEGTTITNSGSLTAGTYVVRAYVSFASNATGRRFTAIMTSNTGTAVYNSMVDSRTAINGAATHCNVFGIITLTDATTLYLRVTQNSGSALSCSGRIEALKIH